MNAKKQKSSSCDDGNSRKGLRVRDLFFFVFFFMFWATSFLYSLVALLAIVAKLPFLPYLPNSPNFKGYLTALYFCCAVGDCGKIAIFTIFERIRQCPQLLWATTLLCAFVALLAIVASFSCLPYLPNSSVSPTFIGYLIPLCFSYPVPDRGKIVIFAIFATFARIANFYDPSLCFVLSLPCWQLWQNCQSWHICQIPQYRQLISLCFRCPVGDCGKIAIFAILAKNGRYRQLLWAVSFLCAFFAPMAIVAKLSFSP